MQSFADSPYSAPGAGLSPPNPNAHPVLALLLGFIPGVGAIYNGQYAKGLIHAVIFGLLISLISSTHQDGAAAFLGIMIGVWTFYQVFEAYHTARKRRYGIAVDEFSSLFDIRPASGKFPIGAVLLIAVGFVLLLDTTDIIRFEEFTRFWPLGLIILGGYMLYSRLNPGTTAPENGGARQ
jgi:TM2 domain-containing membrane protein YozV